MAKKLEKVVPYNYKEKHLAWQTYAQKELAAGRKPTPFKDYQIEPTYYKMINKQSDESRLRSAGIDWEKDKPTAKLRRKK